MVGHVPDAGDGSLKPHPGLRQQGRPPQIEPPTLAPHPSLGRRVRHRQLRTPLADTGVIWLLTPKAGRDGHVEPSDISESTPTARPAADVQRQRGTRLGGRPPGGPAGGP